MTKQVIGIGSTANDGNGDSIRDAFDKCNDNFTELYARMTPVWGTLFPDVKFCEVVIAFIEAVKYLQINEMNGGGFLFISEIVAGTYSAPNYTYTIEISKTTSLASAGDVVMRYTTSAPTAAKTGLEVISLPEYDGSGVYGYMIINWSLLTLGSTYQMPYLADGGIFAFTVNSARYSIKDSLIDVRTVAGAALTGDKEVYVFNSPAAVIQQPIAPSASIVGQINVKNIGANRVELQVDGAETIDGHATGTKLDIQKSVSIKPYGGNLLIVAGEWVEITPP